MTRALRGEVVSADVLFERLVSRRLGVVFGLPGDGVNSFMEAPRTYQVRVRFAPVRHVEGAAFAPRGYAKLSGRPGPLGAVRLGGIARI